MNIYLGDPGYIGYYPRNQTETSADREHSESGQFIAWFIFKISPATGHNGKGIYIQKLPTPCSRVIFDALGKISF